MEETKPKKQILRYNDAEMALLKNTFSDNDLLLKAIQNLFLQLPLNAVQMATLQTNCKGEMLKILRKTFLPELTDDVPFQEVWDMWLGIDMKNKMFDEVVMLVKANQKFLNYFEQQLEVLEKGNFNKEQKIKFGDFTDNKNKLDNQIYEDIFARNTIFASLQGRLGQLVALAGLKDETPEEREKRLNADSAK